MAENEKVAKEKPVEKAKQPAREKPAVRQPNRLQTYFRETVGELRKVSWPTRKEATNLTVVVVIVTFIMSAFLGLLDFIFTQVFALILG